MPHFSISKRGQHLIIYIPSKWLKLAILVVGAYLLPSERRVKLWNWLFSKIFYLAFLILFSRGMERNFLENTFSIIIWPPLSYPLKYDWLSLTPFVWDNVEDMASSLTNMTSSLIITGYFWNKAFRLGSTRANNVQRETINRRYDDGTLY